MGSSIAYFLKHRSPDLKVTVIERDWNVRVRIKPTEDTRIACAVLRLVFDVEHRAVGGWPPSTVRTCKFVSERRDRVRAWLRLIRRRRTFKCRCTVRSFSNIFENIYLFWVSGQC